MRMTEAIWRVSMVALLALGVTSAFGDAMLKSIGVLAPGDGNTAESGVNAISEDGKYVVGYSIGPGSETGDPRQRPIVWTKGAGLQQLPTPAPDPAVSDPDAPGHASGVAIRTGAADGMIGISAGFLNDYGNWQMNSYKASPTDLANGTWYGNFMSGKLKGYQVLVGKYNTAADRIGQTGQWWVAGDRLVASRAAIQGWDGAFSADLNNWTVIGELTIIHDCVGNAMSGGGGAATEAGYDNGNMEDDGMGGFIYHRRALFMNAPNGTDQVEIPGGSMYESEAIGISSDTTPTSGILSGYDKSDADNGQAFIWGVGDASMTLLNNLPGDTMGVANDVNLIDGNYIAAGSSTGAIEQAVIWDTTGLWDNTGQPMLAMDLLDAAGVDVSDWSSLTRITTMTSDGMTVAGLGIWAADGTTRGFIGSLVPEPATLLLILGGLPLLRRRRR